MKEKKNFIWILLMLFSMALFGCGSGGDSSTPATQTPTQTNTVSGVAAAGAPLIGQVTIKGALGNTKSAYIEADGSYSVDVTGLTAPYRLRAEGTVGGRTYKLHSYAEAADVGGTVNITPFTDLIVANAAQQIAESYFDDNTPADLDPAEVDAQEAALQAKLQDVFNALGVSTAIDLLNSTFSADHSGLDAALDIVRIEVDASTNVATITNLVEPSNTITDSIVDDTLDDTGTLTVDNPAALTSTVTNTQAIAAVFEALESAFASGLPTQAAITDYFSTDFYEEDRNRALFLTDITTSPDVIGMTFNSIAVSNLDSAAGTATVAFNWGVNGAVNLEPTTWYAAKDTSLGWQLRGDQRIVETDFSFHCNDNDGDAGFAGACGINTRFWDNDFTNNGTADAPIASGTVTTIDGSDGVTVKDVVYLGTPSYAAPGDVQVYDEAAGYYTDDWKAFGTGLGQIDSSIFAAGDIIQYDLYTEALDVTVTSAPQIAALAVPVATYTDTLLYVPATTGKYPSATSATQTAISNFTLGNSLTVAWTLASGTRSSEVLVAMTDSQGGWIDTWVDTWGSTSTSETISAAELSAMAATLDPTATTYNLLVRVYAEDGLTGQAHSRDYNATIPGSAAVPNAFTCGYDSGWDDIADEPATFNSYTDFEAVVTDCGGALTKTAADFTNTTWTDTSVDASGTWVDTVVYNADGTTGTFTETLNGVVVDGPIPFTWSVANNRVTVTIAGSFLDVWVFTTSGQKVYTEEGGWSSNPDFIPDGTADGEIWTATFVQQ